MNKEISTLAGPSRDQAPQMFNRIAGRYDFLNRFLSGGQDILWRKRVRRHLPDRKGLKVLDMATGTADLLLELIKDPRVDSVLGIDPSNEMLEVGKVKIASHKKKDVLALELGNAIDMSPYHGADFDISTVAFGIRNFPNPKKGLQEMATCMKPGGKIIVLEFSEPEGKLFGPVYRFYRGSILPFIGGVISGDKAAYTYLDETISTFPCGEDFLELMRSAGLEKAKHDSFVLGAVSIYTAEKAS